MHLSLPYISQVSPLVDQLQEALQFGSTLSDRNREQQSSFFSPWSHDTPADLMQLQGRAVDSDVHGLDSSSSSDRFGLGSSQSSAGFALDDLVSKIVDEESNSSVFGLNNFRSASEEQPPAQSNSDVFSFNRFVF